MTQSIHTSSFDDKSVWFITGCSTGFGRELATQLLTRGSRVVVTARHVADLKAFAGNPNALMLSLDVTDPVQIEAAVQAAKARFGQINSDGAGKDRNRPKPASTRVGFSPSFPVHGEPQVSHAEASNAGRTRQHLPSVRLRNADNNTQYP